LLSFVITRLRKLSSWTWGDSLKDVKAYKEAIEQKLTSRRRIVAETHGMDYDDLLDEIEEDEKALKDSGLMAIPDKSEEPVAQTPKED